MSCIALTDQHHLLLAALAYGPRRVDDCGSGRDVVDELRRWGWVFGGEWIELTGAGRYHAGTVVGGLVVTRVLAGTNAIMAGPTYWTLG